MKKKIILGILGAFLAFILVIAGLILIPSLTSSKTSYSEDTTLSIISGEVLIMEAGENTWKEAKDRMDIAAKDSVKTNADSYALITFFDGSTTNIQPNSEITINEMELFEDTGSTIIRLGQRIGETWNRIEKLADFASKYEINTPAGTGTVKGTTIGLVVGSNGETTMKVFEGEGSLLSQGAVTIGEGMVSSVQPGQAPGAASRIPMPDSILRLSVNPSVWVNSVDPIGRSAGMVPPGIVVNQIPGVVTSGYGVEPQFVEIPNPGDGTYNVVLYGRVDGMINLTVEGFVRNSADYTSIFEEERSIETGDGDKWQIDLQAEVVNGILDQVTLPAEIEPLKGDEPGTVIVTEGAVDGRVIQLADSYDAKYDAFKSRVYAAISGEEEVLVFTEDEVAGKIADWATGPDIPVDLYNIEVELKSNGTTEASGKFKYSIFTGTIKVKGKVEIAASKPRVVITSIDIDLGALPIPVDSLKSRINDEAADATWNLPADLINVDMQDGQIILTVVKR